MFLRSWVTTIVLNLAPAAHFCFGKVTVFLWQLCVHFEESQLLVMHPTLLTHELVSSRWLWPHAGRSGRLSREWPLYSICRTWQRTCLSWHTGMNSQPHLWWLQDSVCSISVGHAAPPPDTVVVTSRMRFVVPVPHVLSQVDQWPHDETSQSTGQAWSLQSSVWRSSSALQGEPPPHACVHASAPSAHLNGSGGCRAGARVRVLVPESHDLVHVDHAPH